MAWKESRVLILLGIFQIITALVITAVAITITAKFQKVDPNVSRKPWEIALSYSKNPWTTKYAGGVLVGLLTCIAGIFGLFVDLKPHKIKYKYYTLVLDVVVFVCDIVLIVYSIIAISWFDQCTYIYTAAAYDIRQCPPQVKSTGKALYSAQIALLVINVIATCAIFVALVSNDKDLVRNFMPSRIMYYLRGKGKITHDFNQEPTAPPVTMFQEETVFPGMDDFSNKDFQIEIPDAYTTTSSPCPQ